MLFDTGLNLVQLVLVLACCGFALWKKGWIRILLSVCIIIWATWTMQYDVKIAGTLLALGTLLFFMAILAKIGRAREGSEA